MRIAVHRFHRAENRLRAVAVRVRMWQAAAYNSGISLWPSLGGNRASLPAECVHLPRGIQEVPSEACVRYYCSLFCERCQAYFFLLATTLTLRVCEIAPGVSASLMISACSCWCRFPLPVAGLALSDRPTYRTSRRVSSSRGWMYSRTPCHAPILRGSSCAHTTSADGL